MAAAGPGDHPWHGRLFGDGEMAALFAPAFELAAWRDWELAHVAALGALGEAPAERVREIEAVLVEATADPAFVAAVADGVARDGMGVPTFVARIRARLSPEAAALFHRGGTSQDLIDTMWVLRLRAGRGILLERLDRIGRVFADLEARFGARRLMGRTRMQAALPIRVADRIRLWREPLSRIGERARAMGPRVDVLQYGGPVGDGRPFGPQKARALAREMAARLGLHLPEGPWHAMRDRMLDQGAWLATVAGALGKFAEDVALMSQQGLDDVRLAGGGRSSAMAHKQNPVKAEIMVAMARKASGALGALSEAQIHEQERSGAAWALEWLALSELLMLTGALSRQALSLAADIEALGAEEDG